MLIFAYLRRPPTTRAWRSPLHQPAIMLTFTFDDHRLRTHGDRRSIDRRPQLCRSPTTHAWRSSFHRPAIMLTLYIFDDHRLRTHGGQYIDVNGSGKDSKSDGFFTKMVYFFFHIYVNGQKQKKLQKWAILGQSCQWCRQHQLNLLISPLFIF